ncbi:helix-turn-helix domain-containing protein [uncultured Tenacibaculum sp.]|uniref:helix-turn-helix domain-containing protein n=1 Tax=uncultured Tenacibaculum sp. TaxID=174713 RepID=UPI0026123D7D|nr:helix-turn-helix domain-containing protein [uncultured Tenacibaculum sp.]
MKKKFYLNRKIGIDSTLFYMDKMINANNIPYKTFAYAAIEYLKTREKQQVDLVFFKDSITKYLPKIPITKKNYSILFDIHILLGNTSKRRGLTKTALNNYSKAENYALAAKDIERTIKIKGNIALIYQDMEELNEALLKSKEKSFLIETNKEKLGSKYYINKYKTALNIGAIYATLFKKDTLKRQYADSSLHYYNSVLKNNNFKQDSYYYGRIYYGIGTIYSLKKESSKANFFLEKSLHIFQNYKSHSYLYKGHYNVGVNYYMASDLKNAKSNFLKALHIKNDTLLDYNYMHINNYLSKIYLIQKKSDSANYYLNSFLKAYNKISTREKQQFKEAYKAAKEINFAKKISALNKNNNKKAFYYKITLILLIIILIFSSAFVFKNIKEKKKTKERLNDLLTRISSEEKEFTSANDIKIKDEQHQQIIKGLYKIEEKLYFLKDDFNLYNAAKKIGTNTTYLSKVIKEYKQMSFSDYTNELKINYIINRLSKDKKIRAYTTQAIGEIGGYKNAKSFTRIFKKYTGITPYQFIEKIDKEITI